MKNSIISPIYPNEIFKPVKNYEGLYEVSNFGRVKSLHGKKGIILRGSRSAGYRLVLLYKNGNPKTCKIASIVWDHFGNRKRNGRILQVDHINNNKRDDRIDNLQLLTLRENISKGFIQNGKKTSQYTGVCWFKQKKKWIAHIHINGKLRYLGLFTDEYQAYLAYKKALKNPNKIKRRKKMRKSHEGSKSYLLNMPENKYEKLKSIAKKKGIYISELINMAIDEKLNPLPEKKKWWKFTK